LKPQHTLLTYFALVLTVIFWGTSFVASKFILETVPAWTFLFFRFAASSLLFLLLLMAKKSLRLPKGSLWKLLIIAIFEPWLYFIFESAGLKLTSASTTAIIIAAIPATVALASGFLPDEKLTAKVWIGALLSIGGVALVSLSPTMETGSILGNILVIGAVITATGYIILTRELTKKVSPLQISAYQIFFATILFAPGLFLFDGKGLVERITPELGGAFLYLVIFSTFTAFIAYNYALSKIQAAKAAVFLNGIPLVTMITSWIFLGEQITLVRIIGAALIIAGVSIANRPSPMTFES
jgi:drug/metabolite transporter (DMT)-like permease